MYCSVHLPAIKAMKSQMRGDSLSEGMDCSDKVWEQWFNMLHKKEQDAEMVQVSVMEQRIWVVALF